MASLIQQQDLAALENLPAYLNASPEAQARAREVVLRSPGGRKLGGLISGNLVKDIEDLGKGAKGAQGGIKDYWDTARGKDVDDEIEKIEDAERSLIDQAQALHEITARRQAVQFRELQREHGRFGAAAQTDRDVLAMQHDKISAELELSEDKIDLAALQRHQQDAANMIQGMMAIGVGAATGNVGMMFSGGLGMATKSSVTAPQQGSTPRTPQKTAPTDLAGAANGQATEPSRASLVESLAEAGYAPGGSVPATSKFFRGDTHPAP